MVVPADRCWPRALVLTALSLLVAACGGSSPSTASPFDGARAREHIAALVAIGPRPPNTQGSARARAYIAEQVASYGLKAVEQPFPADTPLGPIPMVNVRVTVPGAAVDRRLVIGGHYDTKRFDKIEFVGANDAGSSTAFLIEMARVLAKRKNPMPIELVFFDGEEAMVEWQGDDNTYGSRYYVEAAGEDGSLGQIKGFLLVDMIGDADLRIKRDSNSTDWMTAAVWKSAERLGRREFSAMEASIQDDHFHFLEAGVPALQLIDMEYPAWHTARDALDKVSAKSLQAVGDVVWHALPDIEKHLAP